nr:hypothetical protein [uncultured bacterium]
MATVIARTGTKPEAFLLTGKSRAAPNIGAVPKRLFASSKEQLRVTLYSLLFFTDIALIAIAFLGAGAIRLGSPFEAQALNTVAVVIPTFIAIAVQNRLIRSGRCKGPPMARRKSRRRLVMRPPSPSAFFFMRKRASHSRARFSRSGRFSRSSRPSRVA